MSNEVEAILIGGPRDGAHRIVSHLVETLRYPVLGGLYCGDHVEQHMSRRRCGQQATSNDMGVFTDE